MAINSIGLLNDYVIFSQIVIYQISSTFISYQNTKETKFQI